MNVILSMQDGDLRLIMPKKATQLQIAAVEKALFNNGQNSICSFVTRNGRKAYYLGKTMVFFD